MHSRRRRSIGSAALLFAVVTGHFASAAPEITIRAHSQLQFDGVQRTPDGDYSVRGHLVDGTTALPLPNQHLVVTFGARHAEATTASDGGFAIKFADSGGQDGDQRNVGVSFAGNDNLDATNIALHNVDIDKQPVVLAIKLAQNGATVDIHVDATAAGVAVTLPVTIHALDDAAVVAKGAAPLPPILGVELGTCQTGHSFVGPRSLLGGVGRHAVRATFAGNDAYAMASIDSSLDLSSGSRATLTTAHRYVAFEDSIDLTGSVTDDDGHPLARAAVTIASGEHRLAQTATRADGSFRVAIEAKLLGSGEHGVQASVDPTTPGISSSQSEPLVINVAAPHPVPVAFTFVAFLATVIVAAGFFLARKRPWKKRGERNAAAVDGEPAIAAPARGGMSLTKPPISATVRRPHDVGFAGTVRDAVRSGPLAGKVRLRLGSEEKSVRAGADGRFEIADLAAGEWTAKVSAEGHISERFTVSIPHHGELRGVKVDLIPVREQIFALYRSAAEPWLPAPRLWGVWSPRQIVDHVRALRSRVPRPALAALTDFVEESYFSARAPNEDSLAAANALVSAAMAESNANGPSPHVS